MSLNEDIEEPPPPVSVLLLRSPVSMSKGTDPYHDAFGSFCLPSFASSALESGTSTPLPSLASAHKNSLHSAAADTSALDLIKTALSQQAASSSSTTTTSNSSSLPPSSSQLHFSPTGRRKGKFIQDQPRLMTHHLSYPVAPNGEEIDIEYCVTSFPILSHKFLNQNELVDRIMQGYPTPQNASHRAPYRGVIITSQRAVEAYTEAGVHAQDILRSKGKSSSSSPTQWNRIPFFAVGPATASALRSLPLAPWLRPRLVMGGEATGTGEALARYVIRHFSSPSLVDNSKPKDPYDPIVPVSLDQKPPSPPQHQQDPILYLVGDKNASTIPDLLSQAQHPPGPILLEELQVYETGPDPHFAEGCEILAKTLPTVISRPPSRRPSSGSLYSRPGSRRPSGGINSTSVSGVRTPNSEDSQLQPARDSQKTSSQAHVPSVGTPLGVSTMTPTERTPQTPQSSALVVDTSATSSSQPSPANTLAVGGSPNLIASPANLEPEPINPIEEESVLKLLRNKVKASAALDSTSSLGTTAKRFIARPDWIVFFSPSGVNYALEEFRKRRWLPPDHRDASIPSSQLASDQTTTENDAPTSDKLSHKTTVTCQSNESKSSSIGGAASRKYPRIAVLGSTTRAWMVENLGIEPDAVASKPGPKELKDAIETVELRLRTKT